MFSQKRKVPVAAAAGTSMYHYAYKTVLTSYDFSSCNRHHHQVLLQVNLILFRFWLQFRNCFTIIQDYFKNS